MKFTLEEYQEAAVNEVLTNLARARRGYLADGELTAVGLTAPTGAGKTVIATAVLESLYFGSENREPNRRLTVLWLTDDRALNAQTIQKIVQSSGGRINEHQIRFLGDTDERTLEPGFIYFVHIQALQKNSTLHSVRSDGTRSDMRTHGAWDMIANTVRDRGEDFLVIWDEAHRGAGNTDKDRKTIARTIVNGGMTNIGTQQPPAPVVLGVSATPDRFYAAMSASGRTMRLAEVPASDVRASGLLKDRILLRSIAEDQQADNTMLAMAVSELRVASRAWRKHHDSTGDRLVEPLLVVQVEPKVTDARLGDILAVIESAWPELTDMAVAHAFGDPHGPLTVGDRTVRYLPPEAISADDRARVVLFKSALTTGWDCPRAEVMVSFQGKESYTDIAQLIGRLVRTPLARRIEDGADRLNEVVAFLPGFKTAHVQQVVRALTEDENVEMEVVISPEVCERSTSVPAELFDRLDTLPSFTRPRATYASRTAQLLRLAAALNEHGLVAKASSKARQWIVDQMRAADAQRADEIDRRVEDLSTLSVETSVVDHGENIMIATEFTNVATTERDLDAYYLRAQRLLPEGSAAWYFNDLCDRGMDDVDAAVRLTAMVSLGFRDIIEEQATDRINTWRNAHASSVSRMPRSVRDLIQPLWYVGSVPMHPTTVEARHTYPVATERVVGDATEPIPVFDKHLFVIPPGKLNDGLFPVDTTLSSWERDVLDRELDAPSLVGWYRNPSSGRFALAIPYEFGEKTLLMHPDFLFWHDDGGGEFVLDIVDPHRHDLADSGPKWSALALYAQDHPDIVRRAEAVIRLGSGLRSLDLTAPGISEHLQEATNRELVEDLFASKAVVY